eukprot:7293520-Pyramimonas_sp.AAC.1
MWRRPSHDDKGSCSIRPHDLLREPLARKAPELRNGALARDFLRDSIKWVEAQLRRQGLSFDTF